MSRTARRVQVFLVKSLFWLVITHVSRRKVIDADLGFDYIYIYIMAIEKPIPFLFIKFFSSIFTLKLGKLVQAYAGTETKQLVQKRNRDPYS